MLFNFCRLSLACVVIYFSSLASTRAAVIVHTIESTGGATLDRFSPSSEFVIPINLKISMDNGAASIESQTWGFNDLISIEVSIPSQSFTFFREKSDFVESFAINSLAPAHDIFSSFQLSTDAAGTISSRNMLVYYDLLATPNDNRTPLFSGDDFISYEAPKLRINSNSQYLAFTHGDALLFVAGTSFTETLTVTAAPEPSSMLLLGLGSLLACVSRRRR